MRVLIAALIVSGAFAGAAHAGDKPVIGPAPGWVKPVAMPPPAATTSDAPVRILLADQQYVLRPGRQTVYSRSAFKIQTPQGLAAGNLSLPWQPDLSDLTVHELRILRGAQTIDVLASGQTFTVVRREQNLENAVLDGVLTANIQPEGLRVGDVVEFAFSITMSDPTIQGHVEQLAAAWNGVPIDRAHLRIEWPKALPVRLRQTASLPALKPVTTGDTTAVELSLDKVMPIVPPEGAPLRYRVGRLLEVTDFASWADLGALLAPLYAKAAVVPADGPLAAELERIRALSPDPRVRAEAALALVQDRVRYVALAMGVGGLVPADAALTWSRRFGDCKGKTALLLALLHAMDITAEPVAVSSGFGDGLDARLPMVGLFDHVLVRATIAGKTYWLDGTRTGDTSLDRLTIPAFGWGLPLVPAGAALVRMMPPPLEKPGQDIAIHIDMAAGESVPAPITVETILRGDEAIGTNAALVNLAGDARERALKTYWEGQFNFVEVKTTDASFDPRAGELRLTMAGVATMGWENGIYYTDKTGVGYKANFSRTAGPDDAAPFAVAYPYFTRTRETIVLPKAAGTFTIGAGAEVDQTAGGIHYRRHAAIADNIFTVEKSERSLVPEFPAADAPAAQKALRALADQSATLREPAIYKQTAEEIAALRAQTPTTAAAYAARAAGLVSTLPKEALADFDKAIELAPDDASYRMGRGRARVTIGDGVGAKADFEKAEALDPKGSGAAMGLGMVAAMEGRFKDAVAEFTRHLALDPKNTYVLSMRSSAYMSLSDPDHALSDLSAVIDIHKARDQFLSDAYATRGGIFYRRSDMEKALEDLDSAIAISPRNAPALRLRAFIYIQEDELSAAGKDIDALVKMDPNDRAVLGLRGALAAAKGDYEAGIAALTALLTIVPDDLMALTSRAEARYKARHLDDALRDATAALKIRPELVSMYLLRANILRSQGKRDEALAQAAAAEAAAPDQAYAHVVAAVIYSSYKEEAEAMKAYDRAIAIKPEAYIYVNRARSRPKADVAARLADLDMALKLEPDSVAALTAKAGAQVDGGDYAAAIATYGAALEKEPGSSVLLVLRGIAYARSGDEARSTADFAAVRAKTTDAAGFNTACWNKAIAGVALESALADCDAALKAAPDGRDGDGSTIRDSRALVLLRLGRLDEAIAEYGRALAGVPHLASSLYGRAIAWARKRESVKAKADAAAALETSPGVADRFKGYGLTLESAE